MNILGWRQWVVARLVGWWRLAAAWLVGRWRLAAARLVGRWRLAAARLVGWWQLAAARLVGWRQLAAALLASVVAAAALVAVGVGRLEVASAVSAPLPDVPEPVPKFSWPLRPPHPVLRPFVAPATPYGPGHRGVDLGGTPGEPVFATAAGVVVFAGDLAGRGVLSIDHTGGLRTTYEPLTPAVVAGERVVAGAIIGHLQPGHPGCPVAACLHWGVRRGAEYLDPLALVLKVRVRLLPWDP